MLHAEIRLGNNKETTVLFPESHHSTPGGLVI